MRLDLILQGRFPEEGVGLLLALSRTLRGTLRSLLETIKQSTPTILVPFRNTYSMLLLENILINQVFRIIIPFHS